ncbi:MAG TPA: LamG-like jellyroll fold domain-containing protein [Pirellulales bacterium]|nr:LamG-like jellyroll fold domain-containing protein [Pirellulales bacterium]
MRSCLATVAAFVCLLPAARGDVAGELKQFTGRPTRLVWVQASDASDLTAQRGGFRLYGLDSEDGKGIRLLQSEPGGYSKPLLTPDGRHVVYSDRTQNAIFLIDFDGGGRRQLAQGFASHVWRDPVGGQQWIYARGGNGHKNQAVVRFRIDSPQETENVWDKSETGHESMPWFRVSADGKIAADAFPWSACGAADLAANTWKQYAHGCWPSIAPDNSYRVFVFHGNHRMVTLFDRGGANPRDVKVNEAPGINGRDVYFPRWSNHARFLTMTGPGIASHDANLYLGRFNSEFTAVEAWLRITQDDKGDFFGDAWIEPQSEASAAASPAAGAARGTQWPANRDGLCFVWTNGKTMNETRDAKSGEQVVCRAVARGRARPGLHHVMDLADGAFIAQGCDDRLLAACKAANGLSLEAVISPDRPRQQGPARIITFSSSASSRNFTLGQQSDRLILRLRTPQTGENGVSPELDLCRLAARKPQHVVVTYGPGMLVCYLDGRQVLATDKIKGDFSNWTAQHLLFGDEWDGARDWAGTLEAVAVFSRVLPAEEVRRSYQLHRDRLAGRKAPDRAIVEAKLLAASPSPDPKVISPYLRALVVNEYLVEKAVEGKCDSPRILVAEWGVMDRKTLPGDRAVGKTYRLALERFDQHPELQPEKLVMDVGELELPLYYAVRE